MLEAIIAEGAGRSVAAIARDLDVPVATAHRQVASLVAEGYLAAGPRVPCRRTAPAASVGQLDGKQVIVNCAAPAVHRLAGQLGCVVQLGTLEGDMVTYRIKTGEGAGDLFTRVGMQLGPDCSGIGKSRQPWLPAGSARPISRPARSRHSPPARSPNRTRCAASSRKCANRDTRWTMARSRRLAAAIAVPIRSSDGRVLAALSASCGRAQVAANPPEATLADIRSAAAEVEAVLSGVLPA
jgi:DNA-binding IclR family transcriptional regulator